jgi:starch synthase
MDDASSVSRLELFVDLPAAFDRPALYGPPGDSYEDNPLRFAALCLAAIRLPEAFEVWSRQNRDLKLKGQLDVRLDIDHHLLHCHDWQAAFAPLLLKQGYSQTVFKTIFTIHNLRHQGRSPAHWIPQLGLSWEDFHLDLLEHWGQLNPLKGALRAVDLVTTVSPTYAREIFSPQFGCELDEYLNAHQIEVTGVVNGLDTISWSPYESSYLCQMLSHQSSDDEILKWKEVHREAVAPEIYAQRSEDLIDAQDSGPWGVMISRFDAQKGVELITELIPDWVARGIKVCILGSGDPRLEEEVRQLGDRFPDSVKVYLGFHLELAHQLFAAADFSLIPSRFEPCGLTQMQSMRYGVIPLATQVGGLADTIDDLCSELIHASHSASPSTPSISGNGFLATEPNSQAFSTAMESLLQLWAKPQEWRAARRRALNRDFSWRESARAWSDAITSLT